MKSGLDAMPLFLLDDLLRGKKDEILSKYHLVACHLKIVTALVHDRRYLKGEYFGLCLCQNLEFVSAPTPLISDGPDKETSVQMHKRCGNCFILYNLVYEKLWF